jgi:hypothetical protein
MARYKKSQGREQQVGAGVEKVQKKCCQTAGSSKAVRNEAKRIYIGDEIASGKGRDFKPPDQYFEIRPGLGIGVYAVSARGRRKQEFLC